MDWQQLTALAIVALTAGVMAWSWRRRRAPGGRRLGACPGCGTGDARPRETVVFHARKGERPEIRVRLR
jgi:hypothetical protein